MQFASKHSSIDVAEVEQDAMCTNRELLRGAQVLGTHQPEETVKYSVKYQK